MFGKHLNWETLYLHGFSMSTFCLPRSCLPHCGGFHTVPPHHHGSETSGCCLGTRDLLQPLGVVGSVAALVVKVGSKPSGKLLCFLMWLFKYRMFIHVYFYTYMYVYRLLCKLHLFIMLYTNQGEWTYVFVFFFFYMACWEFPQPASLPSLMTGGYILLDSYLHGDRSEPM